MLKLLILLRVAAAAASDNTSACPEDAFAGACICTHCRTEPPIACEDLYPAASSDPYRWAKYDYCAFYEPDFGIVRVSEERWAAGQAASRQAIGKQRTPREAEALQRMHMAFLGGYARVQALVERGSLKLGRVLEIGAGPFPQTRNLIQFLSTKLGDKAVGVRSVTLVDPLLDHYREKKASRYDAGRLQGFTHLPLRMLSMPAEAFNEVSPLAPQTREGLLSRLSLEPMLSRPMLSRPLLNTSIPAVCSRAAHKGHCSNPTRVTVRDAVRHGGDGGCAAACNQVTQLSRPQRALRALIAPQKLISHVPFASPLMQSARHVSSTCCCDTWQSAG